MDIKIRVEFNVFRESIVMARRQKKGVRRGGRRTQLLATAVQGAVLANGVRKAINYANKAATYSAKYGKNLRGSMNKSGVKRFPSTMRANSEGYIPNVSCVLGNSKKGLSFTERIQKIMNPPQTLLYQGTGRLDVNSGSQSVSSFTIDNSYFEDFFELMPSTKSDTATAGNGLVDANAASNTVNHLWTSVQHTFMNSGTTTAELDIYVYRALQDCGSADQTITAAATWAYAEQLNAAVGLGSDGATRIGKKPSDVSARFVMNRYWRVLKKDSVVMKPGESFRHYFCEHYNKQYARFMLQGDLAGITKQHSISYVFVLKGQVVGSSIAATVSTGDAQVSYVRSTKLQHCFANNIRPRDLLIGTDLANIAVANQLIINTDTGAQKTGYEEDA